MPEELSLQRITFKYPFSTLLFMSILKAIMIISIIITFTIISGCLDEEPVIQGNAQGLAITATPTIVKNISATQSITVNATTVRTTVPTPIPTTPKQIPKPIDVSEGTEIPWCAIKKECETGIRSYKSEMCISAQQIPDMVMGYYCGTSPIQTPNESATKAPRTESEQKAYEDALWGIGVN